jgi:hypothetical protein
MTRRFLALNYTAYCDQAGVQAADPVNAWTRPKPAGSERRVTGNESVSGRLMRGLLVMIGAKAGFAAYTVPLWTSLALDRSTFGKHRR